MHTNTTEDLLFNSTKHLNEDSWMTDLDPMIEGGNKIAFHQPFPVEIRSPDS